MRAKQVESGISDTAPLSSDRYGSGHPRGLGFRLLALAVGAIPLVLLGIAWHLEPNPQGLGTHQQLGLPPCSMRVVLGIRCPGCGMTTSWAHFMRGSWLSSMQANLGGFLLAGTSIAVSVCAFRAAVRARMPSLHVQQALAVALVGIAAIAVLDWLRRLMS